MEYEYLAAEQAQSVPMRTLPMIRKARRPRRSVFRASYDSFDAAFYAPDGMDYDMAYTDMTNEYGYDDMSIDDILSEYHSGTDFLDFVTEDTRLFDPPEYTPPIKSRQYAPEIDSRFARGVKPEREQLNFGGREIDTYMDENYIPPEKDEYAYSGRGVSSYEDDYYDEDYPEDYKPKKRTLFSFAKKDGKKKKTGSYQPKYIMEDVDEEDEYADSFRDVTGNTDEYAAAADYAAARMDEDGAESEEGYFPPSFREYVASLFAAVFLKVRGSAKVTSATMDDDDEDLGTELSPAQASKFYGSFVHSTRYRMNIALALLGIMIYTSLGFPLPGMLGYLPVTAAMCMAMQFTIMLLALDVVTTGLIKLARLQFGADTLAVISCIVTSIDAAVVAINGSPYSHLPLCAVSSLSLVGVMLSSLMSVRALRKTLRVPAIGKRVYSVSAESKLKDNDITLLKTPGSIKGFVRRCEEAAPDEVLFNKLSPILFLLALALAVVVAAITRNAHDITYIFSVMLTPAIPFTALLCFALPFFLGANKIFSNGAAIAGWSGLCDIGQSHNLIVTDRDLFPEGSVSIDSIRIFADEDAQRVISYAGSMMIASGCCLSKCFSDEMEANKCSIQPIEHFEYLSGGGMKGIIDGHVVLCGSSDLMRLMNVRFPFRLVDKTTVLLSIDGVLYGIFCMNYKAMPQVRKALVELIRSNRHPVFALRDFNITPDMLKDTFDIATDGYDFPPYVERFRITEAKPSKGSKIAAVVCREGLASLTSMADTGRSIYMCTRLNLLLCVLGAVLGMITVFVKLLATGSIGVSFVLMFMLLSALPVFISSVFMKF